MNFVSFIIPHYNSSHLIHELIESIWNQTYKNFEVIIVDDGSLPSEVDNLFNLINKWPELRIFKRPIDWIKGANSCRNFGLMMANGDLINFVDADDILLPNKLQDQIEKFESEVSTDMVVCKTRYFRDNLNNQLGILQKVEFSDNSDYLSLYLSRIGVWCTNSALIKKSSLGEVKFLEGQIDAHEWLFFLKLMINGAKVSSVNVVLVNKRIHSSSIGNLNMKLKVPSLLESRITVYNMLLSYEHEKRLDYINLLISDINSLLRTAAKNGLFSEYLKTIAVFKLSIYQFLKSIFLFYFFRIFKRGTRINVISNYV